jgi:hypothetical protein
MSIETLNQHFVAFQTYKLHTIIDTGKEVKEIRMKNFTSIIKAHIQSLTNN